ncbi:MAG: hypothetical protein WCP73_05235 [Eubacteriales bacterium]
MKLTETQSKAIQIILGIVSGLGIWFAIAIPFIFKLPTEQFQNSILGWLWIIIFAVVMITQRVLEKKYEKRYVIFFRAYLFSLIAGLGLFVLYAVVNNIAFFTK